VAKPFQAVLEVADEMQEESCKYVATAEGRKSGSLCVTDTQTARSQDACALGRWELLLVEHTSKRYLTT
jgi:hypothetical protein